MGKNLVIKVQVPFNPMERQAIPGAGNLMVYTKKRDFVCAIRREDNVAGYEQLREVVRTKGAGGANAYFAAELRSKHELVVKISEVLAEQPF